LPKPETKFWREIKKNLTEFKWVRLESWATQGVPDLLGFAEDGTIFTIELKVAKGRKVRFSPHQIAFHVEHQDSPCLILVKRVVKSKPLDSGLFLFSSSQVQSVSEQGLDTPTLYTTPYPVPWSEVGDALLDALACYRKK